MFTILGFIGANDATVPGIAMVMLKKALSAIDPSLQMEIVRTGTVIRIRFPQVKATGAVAIGAAVNILHSLTDIRLNVTYYAIIDGTIIHYVTGSFREGAIIQGRLKTANKLGLINVSDVHNRKIMGITHPRVFDLFE